jgi:hypothetical protein
MKAVRFLVLAGILALGGNAPGAPPPATPATATAAAPAPVAGPKNELGLTAAIVVNKESYVLNINQSGKAFRDQIDAVKNARGGLGIGRLPQPPAVDLTFRITNTTAKDVTITAGGDDSQMDLKLEGPGAVTADNNVPMTMEFRIGNPVTIAAGKTADVKITSLAFGMRGISKYAYWTEPGNYTITATLIYSTGEKQGSVTSGPAKVKVTKE